MSWLARTIANSLRIDDDDDDIVDHVPAAATTTNVNSELAQSDHPIQPDDVDVGVEEEDRLDNQGRGVKEDLSELKETLTRQLWGVASFLAPPPPPPPPLPSSVPSHRNFFDRNGWEPAGHSGSGDLSDEETSDFAGRFESGIPDRSYESRAVSEFSNVALDSRRFGWEDQISEAVGITDEVLAFAMNIAHHPETWLDFPLFEEEDMDEFDMSDAQHEHALTVERLAPRLAALRIELCPAHMSDSYFWIVYFVLLHSRLNKHDAELLSTHQIVAARTMWMQELQKQTKPEPDYFGRSISSTKETFCSWPDDFGSLSHDDVTGNMTQRAFAFEPPTYHATTEFETEKHPIVTTEIKIIDKAVIQEEPVVRTKDMDFVAGPSHKVSIPMYEDGEDDWLEESSELDGYCGAAIFVGHDEDVSFSDLEDDDNYCTQPIKSKLVLKDLDLSAKSS